MDQVYILRKIHEQFLITCINNSELPNEVDESSFILTYNLKYLMDIELLVMEN